MVVRKEHELHRGWRLVPAASFLQIPTQHHIVLLCQIVGFAVPGAPKAVGGALAPDFPVEPENELSQSPVRGVEDVEQPRGFDPDIQEHGLRPIQDIRQAGYVGPGNRLPPGFFRVAIGMPDLLPGGGQRRRPELDPVIILEGLQDSRRDRPDHERVADRLRIPGQPPAPFPVQSGEQLRSLQQLPDPRRGQRRRLDGGFFECGPHQGLPGRVSPAGIDSLRHLNGAGVRARLADGDLPHPDFGRQIRSGLADPLQVPVGQPADVAPASPAVRRVVGVPERVVVAEHHAVPGQVLLPRTFRGVAVPVLPVGQDIRTFLQLPVPSGGVGGPQIGAVDHPGPPVPAAVVVPAAPPHDPVEGPAERFQGRAVLDGAVHGAPQVRQQVALRSGNHEGLVVL